MKVTFLLITVVSFVCLFSCATEKSNQLEGTWVLSSGEFAGALKIINKTHFATVSQDTSEHRSHFNAGTYSFSGDTYTENIEFFSVFPEIIGDSFSYKIKIEGNQFTMSPLKKEGETEPESQIQQEVWERIE
jgi:hypothetical protein